MTSDRQHSGFLNAYEQAIIGWLLPRIPANLAPDHLTFLAVLGAFVGAASLWLTFYSDWFVGSFIVGLFMHWFGDSFDGAIARYRKVERPRIGFLIDRSSDLVSMSAIILGLAFSPYFLPIPGLLLLCSFLINAFYSLSRYIVVSEQRLAVGGFGATEGRLLLGIWVAFFASTKIDLNQLAFYGVSSLTPIGVVFFLLFLLVFCVRVLRDIKRHGEFVGAKTIHGCVQASNSAVPISISASNEIDKANAEQQPR